MGLVLLRKCSQCLVGPVSTPFDPPTCVIAVKKSVIVNNYRQICSLTMLHVSLMCKINLLLVKCVISSEWMKWKDIILQ